MAILPFPYCQTLFRPWLTVAGHFIKRWRADTQRKIQQEKADNLHLLLDPPFKQKSPFYLHPSSPLKEWKELFALGEIARHVTDAVGWNVLLIVESLGRLLSLLLGLKKVVVVLGSLVVICSVTDNSRQTLRHKGFSYVHTTKQNKVNVLADF